MKQSENWMWFWSDLMEILCAEYIICPYCGSDRVAECYELLCGWFKDKTPYGPFGDTDDMYPKWICADCDQDWEWWESPIEYEISWKDWKHKGKIVK